MLRPLRFRLAITQLMAAITWDTSTPPSATATLMLTSRAPGAIPSTRSGRRSWSPPAHASSAATMMPAKWVPWPLVSRVRKSGLAASKEKSGPRITLLWRSPSTSTTPVSMRAMSTPAPVYFSLSSSSPMLLATL